jgi:hypothetical protein
MPIHSRHKAEMFRVDQFMWLCGPNLMKSEGMPFSKRKSKYTVFNINTSALFEKQKLRRKDGLAQWVEPKSTNALRDALHECPLAGSADVVQVWHHLRVHWPPSPQADAECLWIYTVS